MMCDVANDRGEKLAQRALGGRPIERGMAHAGADRELAARRRQFVQAINAVDVDQVPRPRQPECHDRHEALSTSQHAAVLRSHFGKQRDRFVDCPGRVIAKRSWLHRGITTEAVIPGRTEGANPESMPPNIAIMTWMPGSPLRSAPE